MYSNLQLYSIVYRRNVEYKNKSHHILGNTLSCLAEAPK